MKNILVIAYYYPPKGGIGVQRTVKFIKYLNKLGYNVHVLTVNEEQCGSLVDHSLNRDLNQDIKVHRTYIREGHLTDRVLSIISRNRESKPAAESSDSGKGRSTGFKSFLLKFGKKLFLSFCSLVYVPDAQKGWVNYAVEEAKKVIKENNIDVIFSTSSPYTSHLIGYRLSRELHVKWVADFRDPWVSNSFTNYNSITRKLNSRLEKRVILGADRVISVSQPIIDDFLLRYPQQKKDKFAVVTNGYDEDDFEHLDLNLSDNNSRFTILYNGTLYGNESPEEFFSAIHNLISSNRMDKDKIKIKFIGDMGSIQKEAYTQYKNLYPEVFERSDFIAHGESLMELCKANALLLILSDFPGNERIYTGKLFEYIRTGKPVLGIIPDGVARDLIMETRSGYAAYPSDIEEIEKIILKSYTRFINNNPIKPDWDKIRKYSRQNLASKLDRVIQDIRH